LCTIGRHGSRCYDNTAPNAKFHRVLVLALCLVPEAADCTGLLSVCCVMCIHARTRALTSDSWLKDCNAPSIGSSWVTTRLVGDLGSADDRAATNDEDNMPEVTRCSHLVSTADRRHSFHQLQSVMQPADKRYYCS